MYIKATEKNSQGSIREFDTLTLQQGSSEESPIDTTLVLSLRFCDPHHTSSSPAQDRRGGKESDPGRTDSESPSKAFSLLNYQPPPPRLLNHAAMTKLERCGTDREIAPNAGAAARQPAFQSTWTFEVSGLIKQSDKHRAGPDGGAASAPGRQESWLLLAARILPGWSQRH